MEGKIKIGPVGYNQGGTAVMVNWDEGSHNGIISQIFLSHDSEGIFSIQFQFVLDDKFILSDLHGQNTGYMFNVISLNCPHEYITGISGTLVTSSYSTACPHIKSLKFTTNTNEYGPFGKFTTNTNEYSHFGYSSSSSDKEFKFTLGNQFGGFYGTYDVSGLQYIGVYLQPTTVRPKSKSKTGTSDAEEIESKIVLS